MDGLQWKVENEWDEEQSRFGWVISKDGRYYWGITNEKVIDLLIVQIFEQKSLEISRTGFKIDVLSKTRPRWSTMRPQATFSFLILSIFFSPTDGYKTFF